MGAYVKFVKPEHVEIIEEYLDEEGVVLVMPEMHELAEDRGFEDGQLEMSYDFGGEADRWVDIVRNKHHLLFSRDEGDE